MAGLLDYITWRGDLSFEVAPINELDVFLCTQVAMADLEGIVRLDGTEISLLDTATRYFDVHNTDVRNLGVLQSDQALPAFMAMGKAARYRDIMMSCHVNYVCDEDVAQFSATSFGFSPQVHAVIFRGTDDSIIGWKENCNLAIFDEVPAQYCALKYLEEYAAKYDGKLIVAGHSKGGNLAVYAASNAAKEIQDRIVQVYNFDGPGFSKKFLETNTGYAAVRDRISTIVPQNSIVGILMDAPGRMMVVRANAEGLLAHDGFSWEVDVNHFVRVGGLNRSSRNFDEVFDNMMNNKTEEEKKAFVDELFGILFDTGAHTLSELKKMGWLTTFETITRMTGNKAVRDILSALLLGI